MPPLETSFRLEPCLLESFPAPLADVISELAAVSSSLGQRLHPQTAASLAALVRVMNCYYSNLIEGHNTLPRDIERALADELVADRARRDLQLEAKAHIRVQAEIDARLARGEAIEPASLDFVRWLHREFYTDAPASALRIERKEGSFELVPGELRASRKHDVVVGRHQPPSSARVLELMQYFEQRYRFAPLGTAARIAAMAAAHHRLNYIHPFPDGNGRVSRLMSHAMAARAGIGAHSLWSISRGLARGLEDAGEYKRQMDAADAPRAGDLDGRGNLSLRALEEFVLWFCRVALDQASFMRALFELDALSERLTRYVREDLRASEAASVLAVEVLRRGEIARGEAPRITGRAERAARDALSKLTDEGLLVSDTPKGPVRLAFSSRSADVLFPRLFPAQL
jgi:Fic family protein